MSPSAFRASPTPRSLTCPLRFYHSKRESDYLLEWRRLCRLRCQQSLPPGSVLTNAIVLLSPYIALQEPVLPDILVGNRGLNPTYATQAVNEAVTWWAKQDLNLRPPADNGGARPTETPVRLAVDTASAMMYTEADL
jgi:hypothetical protein